jgi:hypothetical protein
MFTLGIEADASATCASAPVFPGKQFVKSLQAIWTALGHRRPRIVVRNQERIGDSGEAELQVPGDHAIQRESERARSHLPASTS